MDGSGDSVGCCFPERKESRQGAIWIVEDGVLATASSGSESRQSGASSGAVSVLAGPREAMILYTQGEAGQRTASASEARIIGGLTATLVEAGRVAGAYAVVAGAGPRD